MLINPVGFSKFAPGARPGMLAALDEAARKHNLSGLPLAHWLGQMHVESHGYSVLVESLNYSVEGLRKTFGKHRITDEQCNLYGRTKTRPANQVAIGNIVYGGEWGRKNLGNTDPGDGWRFRGSGVKQITGRANTEASGFTPEELRTDLAKSCDAAARFFITHGCIPFAEADDVPGVTKRVNGGDLGLAARIATTAEAKGLVA
jgi:putative chitinase